MTAGLLLLLAVLMFLGRHDETIADWLATREREFLRK